MFGGVQITVADSEAAITDLVSEARRDNTTWVYFNAWPAFTDTSNRIAVRAEYVVAVREDGGHYE